MRDGVLRNLDLMGVNPGHVVISSNIPLRRDGLPYANTRSPEDPGIAVYWYDRASGQQRCIACDRWDKAIDNLRAIELSLEAMRGLDRWGSSQIVGRAFAGFSALPPSGDDWRSVLGFPSNFPTTVFQRGGSVALGAVDEVKKRYRELASRAHPDIGGSEHEMVRLNQAFAAAKKELGWKA